MQADSREQISRLERPCPKRRRSISWTSISGERGGRRRLLVRIGWVIAVSIALAVVGAALASWASLGLRAPQDADRVSITEDPVSKLSVGDCVRDMSADLLEVVDCSEPHTDEVYAKFTLPVEDYPGDKRAEFLAWTGCDLLLEKYTGLRPGRYKFEEYINGPTAESWAGNRSVVCTVAAAQIPSTGSLRNHDE